MLGVADKPVQVAGIADDLATGSFAHQPKPEDAYALAITQTITGRLGGYADLLGITFYPIRDQRVCRLAIRFADRAVMGQSGLLVRGAKGKFKLKTAEAIEYMRRRFGTYGHVRRCR